MVPIAICFRVEVDEIAERRLFVADNLDSTSKRGSLAHRSLNAFIATGETVVNSLVFKYFLQQIWAFRERKSVSVACGYGVMVVIMLMVMVVIVAMRAVGRVSVESSYCEPILACQALFINYWLWRFVRVLLA